MLHLRPLGVLQGPDQPRVHDLSGVGAHAVLHQYLPELGASAPSEVSLLILVEFL
jgi:hypothetical protein